jgi:uncharacterized protein YbjQ (UPF0145 family)
VKVFFAGATAPLVVRNISRRGRIGGVRRSDKVRPLARASRSDGAGRKVTQIDQAEDDMLVTTTNDIEGHRITRYLGLVRGLTVRSRSVVGNIGAGIQSLFGGNITIYTGLAEKAREEAYELMVQHATQLGANAIVAMRYDANEITDGITEVLAYGTAVVVEQG